MNKRYIFAPGPVAVPPEVLLAGAAPTIHHRTDDFIAIFASVQTKLRKVFRTEHPVVTLISSGTGAVEAAMVSTIAPGETVIVVNSGKFGERWVKVAKAYGMNCIEIKVGWGHAVAPEEIKKAIEANPKAKAVVLSQTETSTGAVNDIQAIAAITRTTETLLIVDSVSAFLAEPMEMDAWGVDMVCTGSQKALMLPPGLGLVAVGARAQKAIETTKGPKFYLDLGRYLKSLKDNDVPFTPAVNLIYSLEKALDVVLTAGVEETWARHLVLAKACRAAVKAVGLSLYASSPSVVVTTVNGPAGIDTGKIVKELKLMGITIAGGQDEAKGKIFRFATLGFYDVFDAITIVSAIEMALGRVGHQFTPGSGVAAALNVVRHYNPAKGWRVALEDVTKAGY